MINALKGKAKTVIRKPLQIVLLPYKRWQEQKKFEQSLQEEQNTIREEAGDKLAAAHDLLWSRWPEVIEQVKDTIQRKENSL